MRTFTNEDRRFVEMSEPQFDVEFTLVDNGEESAVWEWEEVQAQEISPNRIWTWVDGDSGETCLVSGVHVVNRFGYGVTEEAYAENYDYSVTMDDVDECPEDGADGWDSDSRVSREWKQEQTVAALVAVGYDETGARAAVNDSDNQDEAFARAVETMGR